MTLCWSRHQYVEFVRDQSVDTWLLCHLYPWRPLLPRYPDSPDPLNMNPIPELTLSLKQLRLSGILDTLEARNREAIDRKLAYTDFLTLLIQDEIAWRDHRKLDARMRRANFRGQKTLEGFDFDRLPNLNRAVVHDLATCRFIDEKVSVLIAGPCGTGKSHLAQALGHAAARQGHDVLFMTQTRLLGALRRGRAGRGFLRTALPGACQGAAAHH